MATTSHLVDATAIARTRPRRNPLVLWHLLSLDAPTVAMLWTWFIARANHINLPITAVLAMGIAVWLLYAADRLLDARLADIPLPAPRTSPPQTSGAPFMRLHRMSGTYGVHPAVTHPNNLEPRHHFHRLHQRAFRIGILLATCVLAILLPRIPAPSIHLYLVLGTMLVGYFLLIHIKDSASAHRLPKELAVGVFFSAAVFIPTIAREPSLRLTLLPAALLFAILCSLNCLFIYRWEHPAVSSEDQTHPATSVALRFLIPTAIVVTAAATCLLPIDQKLPRTIPAATALATALLLLLDRNRRLFAPTTLRAAADLCLLTPLLFLIHA